MKNVNGKKITRGVEAAEGGTKGESREKHQNLLLLPKLERLGKRVEFRVGKGNAISQGERGNQGGPVRRGRKLKKKQQEKLEMQACKKKGVGAKQEGASELAEVGWKKRGKKKTQLAFEGKFDRFLCSGRRRSADDA